MADIIEHSIVVRFKNAPVTVVVSRTNEDPNDHVTEAHARESGIHHARQYVANPEIEEITSCQHWIWDKLTGERRRVND
jgi:hypothetical protein